MNLNEYTQLDKVNGKPIILNEYSFGFKLAKEPSIHITTELVVESLQKYPSTRFFIGNGLKCNQLHLVDNVLYKGTKIYKGEEFGRI
jgi:hypothetical protein